MCKTDSGIDAIINDHVRTMDSIPKNDGFVIIGFDRQCEIAYFATITIDEVLLGRNVNGGAVHGDGEDGEGSDLR